MSRILVLKAPSENSEDDDPYVTALTDVGMHAEGLSVLSFEYINHDVLRDKMRCPEKYSGLIFTSPRSVMAVCQCMGGDGLNQTRWADIPSYVVGEGTSLVLQEMLSLSGIGQESGNAQKLSDFILQDSRMEKCKPLLFPCAEQKRAVLPDNLAASGLSVDCVPSYRTVPHPLLEENLRRTFGTTHDRHKPNTLVFFSPTGVHAVVSQLQSQGVDMKSLKMVAIGPTTECALREKGFPIFATAAKPSPRGLVESLRLAAEVQENVEN